MGASGLLAAYKARKMLNNYELVCYEKNASIGGTWFVNRYPGCACDIPAHTYTFPWDPNPDWSQFYAGSEEIQRYFEGFLHKHLLEPFVRLNTEVLHAEWREYEGLWNVTLRNTGSGKEMWTDTCNVLINGSGVLSKWQWPAIEGLFDFKGVLAHSAVWPQNLDWSGKKVAVIGTGSSSIQMVPKLAQTSERLTVFMRSNTYIGAPWGTQVTNTEADPEALDPVAEGMHRYTEKEKRRFREDPDYFLRYRTSIEREIANRGWDMYNRGTELNISVKKATQNSMRSRLGNRDDLKQRIIPDWSPGCRRLTPGEGYLEALTEPNVHCEFDAIEKITSRGLVTKAGTQHDVDIIACATGFYVQYQPHFKIVGKNGEVMQNIAEPNVYASVAAPGFPNYFVINGPRGNWGQGCALPSHEVQMEYVLQCCRKMQEDRIKCMEPKQSVTRQMNEYMDAWHAKVCISFSAGQ